MRCAKVGTLISMANWDNRKLSEDDCTADSRCDFFCAFNTKTDMAIKVPDGNKGLETCALASMSLLLHGHNLHNFIL